MTSRVFAVVFAAVVVAVVVACHRAAPELVQVDASSPVATSSSPAAAADTAGGAAPADAGDADSGLRAALHDFCGAAFSADEGRMHDKCAPDDFKLNQSMGKAAANVCANDLAIALGRSRADFDPDAGRRCVEMLHQKQLAQTSETDSLYSHPPCDAVLVGRQPEGEPCRFSVECKDGLACVGYKIGVDGTCKKPPASKEACTLQPYGSIVNVAASAMHHPACAAGAFCDGTTCQPRVQPGKACSKSEACASSLSCVMGKCGPRQGTGSACASAGDCTFGLWCDRTGSGGTGKCAAKHDDGQSCESRDMCKGRCDSHTLPDGHTLGKCVAVCGSG